jgi:hypothetical protein
MKETLDFGFLTEDEIAEVRYFHLVPSRNVDLYIHSPISLRGIVLS